MNPFDITIVVILGYCVILGVLRGFIREVAAIIGILGGFYLAFGYYNEFALIFSPFTDSVYSRQIIAFLLIFCTLAAGIALLGILLRTFLRMVFLGAVDRIAGALFGGIKALVIISFLHFLLLTFLPRGGVQMVRESRLAPAVNGMAAILVYAVPGEMRKDFIEKMESVREQWEHQEGSGPQGENG